MAFSEPTLLHPDIDNALVTAIAAGAGGAAFLSALNARIALLAARDEQAMAYLEQATRALGNGWLSGGAITAGTGLSANIAAGSGIAGSFVQWTAEVVGGLTAGSLNYIWLRQAGAFTPNVSGTPPTGDGLGDAVLWGTATTDATSVTGVSNTRAVAGTLVGDARYSRKFATNVGDGVALVYNVAHNLGTEDIEVGVWVNATGAEIRPTLLVVDANTLRLTYTVAPAAGADRVVVLG